MIVLLNNLEPGYVSSIECLPPYVKIAESYESMPLQLSATDLSMPLAGLLAEANASLRRLLLHHGALLFRGFPVEGATHFCKEMAAFGGSPLQYEERSTPRTRINDSLYTATEYPAREPIFLHNENAYASEWPRFVAFYCEWPATSGGEMTLASTRSVRARIPDALRYMCSSRGLMYTRRFVPGLGYTWRHAFGVETKAQLDQVLTERGYRSHWEGEHLVVQRAASWTTRHPETGEELWFNHGVFFNALSLPAATRAAFGKLFGQGIYPHQTTYADGSEIEAESYALLRCAYEQASIMVRLQRGDVLLIDNLLAAHGREPYVGQRHHYVTMLD